MMQPKRALLLLGGLWHDFDGLARALNAVVEKQGWVMEASYDLDRLLHLDREGISLVIMYTCFSRRAEAADDTSQHKMSDAQIAGLTDWVQNGGALLALHASTVLGDSSASLGELLGGVFIEHPPAFSFSIHPIFGSHPITAGIAAFTVHDEMYIEQCGKAVTIHMIAVKDGVAYPLVWSRPESRGRVAHIALGHSSEVWGAEPYQRLILQTIGWLTLV